MSGHSKWHTIKHKKGALDAKRGKLFTRLIKEMTVAARNGGGDINMNPRLRTVVAEAKAANMPAENIKRAIQRGTGELPGVTYEEINYEGYGPGGAAIIIETMTDNKNRTVGEIRHMLAKFNGNLVFNVAGNTTVGGGWLSRWGRGTAPASPMRALSPTRMRSCPCRCTGSGGSAGDTTSRNTSRRALPVHWTSPCGRGFCGVGGTTPAKPVRGRPTAGATCKTSLRSADRKGWPDVISCSWTTYSPPVRRWSPARRRSSQSTA